MASPAVVDSIAELELLTGTMINQLKQLENIITVNRQERHEIILKDLSPERKWNEIRTLDLIFHQALKIRKTAYTLLNDLEHTLTLETILKYI